MSIYRLGEKLGLLQFLVHKLGYDIHRADGLFLSQSKLIANPLVIFDVGAFVGGISKQYRSQYPRARIYSFEPMVNEYCKLCLSFKRDKNIIPKNLALSNWSGRHNFFINRTRPTSSLYRAINSKSNIFGHSDALVIEEIIGVEVTTIDRFCQTEHIEKIDILKVDAHGSELDILEGADFHLSKGVIGLISIELPFYPAYQGQRIYHHICSYLFSYGYRLYGLYNMQRWSSLELGQADAVFIKRK